MADKFNYSDKAAFMHWKGLCVKRLVVWGLFSLITTLSFGQVGPYFYGKPNSATGVPDPPVPAASYYTMGANEGLPKYLDPTPDQINPPSDPQFLSRVIAALPEGVNRSNNLGIGGAADITVREDSSEIYLVFVTEGASAKNALGYYIYKGDLSPTDLDAANPLVPGKSYLESRRIIFPNSSLAGKSPYNTGSGGGRLNPGDRVQLIGDLPDGRFSKGTRIAWFVVSYGWNGKQVDNGRGVLYSNPALNPQAKRQAALLDFSISGTSDVRTVITFDDTKRATGGGADNDFNDVVFYVNQKGGQTVYYPDCSGKFVLTKEEYDKLPKDANGKLICTPPTPTVTNLRVSAICSEDPTLQLGWKITNPNPDTKPFTWVITDGVSNTVKLSSATVLDAQPGDNIIYTSPVSGVNAISILVDGTAQPAGTRVLANTVPCDTGVVVPPLNCCVTYPTQVISYKPGTTRAGGNLDASRTDSSQALGPVTVASSFVSLGFNGGTPDKEASVVLKFPQPVRGFLNIYETTFGTASSAYIKTAEIWGSLDGSVFYKIGTANNQEKGSVDLHRTTLELKGDFAQIQYIKVLDVTPKATVSSTDDGFHLAGACASDFGLVTVDYDPNANPGNVKVDTTAIVPHQAKRRDGTPVWSNNPNMYTDPGCVQAGLCDPEGINRSDIHSILARDVKFYSLGIGGSIEVEFEQPVTGSLVLYERTGDPKPTSADGSSINYIEKVAIYVKTADCNEWGDPIGYADNQGPQLGPPDATFDHQTYKAVVSLGGRTVKYVKLVDVTPSFSTSTDGYDLDYIASTANATTDSSGVVANPDTEAGGRTILNQLVVNSFPNPSSGNLTIDFGYRETGFVPDEAALVTVTDFMGKVVSSYTRPAGNTDPLKLDLSNQPNGLYLVNVRSGSTSVSQKILLQR